MPARRLKRTRDDEGPIAHTLEREASAMARHTEHGAAAAASPEPPLSTRALAYLTAQATHRVVVGILKKVSSVHATGHDRAMKRVRFTMLEVAEEVSDDGLDYIDQFDWEAGAAAALMSMTRAC
jgi:hypothetical protein